jgi:hypothetical protein
MPSGPTPVPGMEQLAGPMAPEGAGDGQVGSQLIKMGFEVDQALKLMAKVAPVMAPFVMQTVTALQTQIQTALASGLSQLGSPDANFPDGSSRMSGL